MSTGQAILAAMTIRIRPTTLSDVAALPAIERAAAGRFRDIPELARLPTARSFPLSNTSTMPNAG